MRALLADEMELSERKMFGGLAFMVWGNMCCGIVGKELMVRVGPEQYAAALAQPHARESVANNLNDIAKDHPDLVVETIAAWRNAKHPGTQWIIGHAARTLLKQGHAEALALLGYPPTVSISVSSIRLNQTTVRKGDDLVFEFDIQSTADVPQNLMIDYIIHHMKANGRLTPKVFKLAKKRLLAHQMLHLSKQHSFRAINTRAYYPGQHILAIQINGTIYEQQAFDLT